MKQNFRLRFGHRVIEEASAGWPPYLLLTTQPPCDLVRPRLAHEPVAVGIAKELDLDHLEHLEATLPDAELVVGCGGGTGTDAGKFVAMTKGLPLVLAPSALSTNAMYTDFTGTSRKGVRASVGPTPLPREILLDLDLLAQAPARMNRAGASEILCGHTGVRDWELAAHKGYPPPMEAEVVRKAEEWNQEVARLAGEIRTGSELGLRRVAEINAEIGDYIIDRRHWRFNGGSDHYFVWNLSYQTGKRFLHAEGVALGILIMSYFQKNRAEEMRDLIRSLSIAYLPEELGLTWEDVQKTLRTLPDFARREVKEYSIIDEMPTDDRSLRDLRAFLTAQ